MITTYYTSMQKSEDEHNNHPQNFK